MKRETLKPGCWGHSKSSWWCKLETAGVSSRILASLSQEQLKGAGSDLSHPRSLDDTYTVDLKWDFEFIQVVLFAPRRGLELLWFWFVTRLPNLSLTD